jgi:hypothetical protein
VSKWRDNNPERDAANQSRWRKQRRKEIGKMLDAIKAARGCVDCGINDPIVLEFDHITGKQSGIAELKSIAANLDRIKTEIDKCVVRCANCHRRRHYLDRSNSTAAAGNNTTSNTQFIK